MKRIDIKSDHVFLKLIDEKNERHQAMAEKYRMPEVLSKYIHDHAEFTAKLNGDDFCKQTFRLGMLSMWTKLINLEMVNREPNDEPSVASKDA
jgi:glutamine cyclotransferase